MPNADYFAYNQYRDYIIYKELAKSESNPEFKAILENLVQHEYEDYTFWLQFSKQKKFWVPSFDMWRFKLIRKVLGLTFAAKFLEGRERKMINAYSEYLKTVDDEKTKREISQIIAHELEHEEKFISQIKEERVAFLGNIVLGLNDGLIELSGALVGFSLAFANPLFVALSGIIIGFSASFSMAASAFMQARYEESKGPIRAALYTGFSYMAVVVVLVLPFLLLDNLVAALVCMLLIIALIIISLSFYSSVLFNRSFLKQAGEMAAFSIGVALVTFVLGLIIRQYVPSLSTLV